MKRKVKIVCVKDGTLEHRFVDVDTALRPIEIPSQLDLDKAQGIKVVFHYPESTERYKAVKKDNLTLRYGETSGRIKEVYTKLEKLLDTDLYKVSSLIVPQTKNLRFKSNVKDGLGLVKTILAVDDQNTKI